MPRTSFRLPRFDKLLFWALCALLVWAPVPLGSNRGWAWGLLATALFALTALWLAAWAAGRASVPVALRRSWPAFVLFAAWMAVQAVHVVPMEAGTLAAISPESARMHALVGAIGERPAQATISLDPHASQVSLLKTLAYGCAFFLTLALVYSRPRILLLARLLVAAAVVQSVIAVLLHLSGVTGDWFGTTMTQAASASGSYANRNHFAGYLVMTLALGIGLLIAGLSDQRAASWRHFARNAIEWILSPKMLLRLALCILVIALTTTHSRMGNAAFFGSLLIAGAIGIALSRRATRNTVVLLVSLVVLDLTIVGGWFGVEKLAVRLEQTTRADVQVREDPAGHTLAIAKDYPVLGAGPGSFYVVFPRYRPPTVATFFDHAHNDYAEFLAGSGWLGLGLILAFVATCTVAALRAQWQRTDPLMRGLSFACIMSVTALAIHSWVDFNFQIPANAALFMAILALGWISLHLDRRS